MSRLLCLMLTLCLAAPAAAQTSPQPPPDRGPLTGLGLALSGAGLASLTLGVGSLLSASEADALLRAYYPTPNSAPLPDEAPGVLLIEQRRDNASQLGVGALIAGGVLLAGGIVCLVLDTPKAPALSVAPTPGGGWLVSFGGRF